MSINTQHLEVPIDELRWTCDPELLGIESTAEIPVLEEYVIAQERAVSALKFGLGMPGNDYNIFLAGEPKTGLTYLTRTFLRDVAKQEPTPPDWIYVHNFNEPDCPKAISLSPGQSKELAKDMEELLEELKIQIPELFASDEYRQRRDQIIKEFTLERNRLISELEEKVRSGGFILNMSQEGMMIVPASDDHIMTEEELSTLSDDDKETLRKRSEGLHEEMHQTVSKLRRMEKKIRDKNKDLDRRMALHAVGYMIDDLEEKYADNRAVIQYLVSVKNDVIKNLDDFKQKEQPQMPFPMPQQQVDFTRYKVNVVVDNAGLEGAPVIYETNPMYPNLMGSMERRASFGALFTDFTMIKPGSIHKANGGYLVIHALDILRILMSWEALKRSLKTRKIAIEDPAEMMGLISTKGMKPEPIDLKVKVVLIGQPHIYNLLYAYDEQFTKLFKVKAHLDDQVAKEDGEIARYSAFAAKVVTESKIRHVDKTGIARLIEYGVEIAGRKKKLTLKMAMIRDILREANYWASQGGLELIGREEVEKAIRQMIFRANLYEEKIQEFILDGYVNIETSGRKAGQINGLSVYNLGDHMFGQPSRITATISLGREGVVNIDRESKLSGNIHTKGVLILEGYLKGRYAKEMPLSLSASLVFEQSYGMVDGDSASGAELYVLLSSLTGVEIKQSIAVTGAISQLGQIQPIGGVIHKIEGFYEVCLARGLTGDQGVIIPKANIPDLMLKREVIDAVKEGKFKIWAVDHADEALEILTDTPAGSLQEDGTFPEGTLNRMVQDKLSEMMEKARKLMKEQGENKPVSDENSGE